MFNITPALLRMIADFAESGNKLAKDPLLGRQAAAEFLGVQPHTLAVWASTGRHPLPVIKIGRLAKYRKSDLETFVATRTHTTCTESTLAVQQDAGDENRH